MPPLISRRLSPVMREAIVQINTKGDGWCGYHLFTFLYWLRDRKYRTPQDVRDHLYHMLTVQNVEKPAMDHQLETLEAGVLADDLGYNLVVVYPTGKHVHNLQVVHNQPGRRFVVCILTCNARHYELWCRKDRQADALLYYEWTYQQVMQLCMQMGYTHHEEQVDVYDGIQMLPFLDLWPIVPEESKPVRVKRGTDEVDLDDSGVSQRGRKKRQVDYSQFR